MKMATDEKSLLFRRNILYSYVIKFTKKDLFQYKDHTSFWQQKSRFKI